MEEEIEQPEPLHTFVDPSRPNFPAPLDVHEDPISEAAYDKKLMELFQMTPTTNELPPFMNISPGPEIMAAYPSPYSSYPIPPELAYQMSTSPSPTMPYPFFGMDFTGLESVVGKASNRNRKRATGKVSYDKNSGKKVITAATCVACFRSKKKCIYTVGSDSCTLCSKRGQACIKRIDRRCQKIWTETGRTMGTYSKPKHKQEEPQPQFPSLRRIDDLFN